MRREPAGVGLLKIRVTMNLESQTERFSLVLFSDDPLELPSRHERGVFARIKVEPYSPRRLERSKRFRKQTLS